MQNVTEYLFHAPNWRLMVRSSDASVVRRDLATIAREYADGMGLFLDADNTLIGTEESGPHGGRVVRINANLPGYDLHAALLKFGDSRIVELSLIANQNAPGATEEFARLLGSVRPAGQDAVTSVARALRAESRVSQEYPAGSVQISLTADYQTPREFVLESADGNERYMFAKPPIMEMRSAGGPPPGASLAETLVQAVGEDGRVVKFEVATMPRFSRSSSPRSAVPETAAADSAIAFARLRSLDSITAVGDQPITVRFEGSQATAEKAADLLRVLKGAQ